MESQYVALKVRPANWGRKPEIKALAVGTKEEMLQLQKNINERNRKRNWSVGYYIAVHKVG